MSRLVLKGLVGREVAALFTEQLAGLGPADAPITLDLSEADLEDGVVTAALVDGLRQAASRAGSVQLLSPPQVLAHALYRVGALGSGTIHLVEPRFELATSS
jgi:anti-anti-sigma regulatory factor